MSTYKDHQILIKQTKLALQKTFPEIRVFDRHVGLLYTKRGTPIKINKKGMADCYAIYNQIHIEMEFKSGKAVLSKDQKNWRDMCLKINCPWVLVRSVQDAIDFVNNL